MFVKVVYPVIFLFVFVTAFDIGDRCVTPNGEVAKCTAVTECDIIRNALTNRVQGAAEFAKRSQCGKSGQLPLVCCGTSAITTHIEPPLSCRTPNGEPASCIPLTSCNLMVKALETRNKDAIKFCKNSRCDIDEEERVCCGSEAYPLLTNLLPNRTICGEQNGVIRIYGGEITQIWEFPWVALLRYKNNDGSDAGFRCGGTVINNRYVLTAAHCVSIPSYLELSLDQIRLGEWRVSTSKDCDEGSLSCADPVIDLNIEEEIVHPQFKRRRSENDIALLRLERNVDYSVYIQPICLPVSESPEPNPGFEMFIAGWGATENGSNSDIKLKLKLPIVSRSYCSDKLRSVGGVGNSQICAGGEGGKDSCQGDSGGPLMRSSTSENLNAKPKWYQEGIISRGAGCGVLGYPGIYTRVADYMDWIIENLKSF